MFFSTTKNHSSSYMQLRMFMKNLRCSLCLGFLWCLYYRPKWVYNFDIFQIYLTHLNNMSTKHAKIKVVSYNKWGGIMNPPTCCLKRTPLWMRDWERIMDCSRLMRSSGLCTRYIFFGGIFLASVTKLEIELV